MEVDEEMRSVLETCKMLKNVMRVIYGLMNMTILSLNGSFLLKAVLVVIIFTSRVCGPFRLKLIHGFATVSSSSAGAGGREKEEETVVLLYNKPPNVISSHKSDDSRSTVYEEVQSMRGFLSSNRKKRSSQLPLNFEQATGIRSKLHAIGRLDANTSGLLLLTNDGRLLHHVTNPKAQTHQHEHYMDPASTTTTTTTTTTKATTSITKTYKAYIMGYHNLTSLQAINDGVDIGSNYVTKPVDDLHILDHPNHKSTTVTMTISEGKNRQIRKMFHAIGSGVMQLQRTRIGNSLTLEGVQGELR